jgi:nucleoside-diphosphate-sugar epimerase
MKVLLTGASGFLGRVIQQNLAAADHEIISLSRHSSLINCDLSYTVPVLPEVDLIIHLAGKAHSVPKTEVHKQEFFETNVNGTINLLKGLERNTVLPKSFVFISSVAVYGRETGTEISENAPLLAIDAYGKSKIVAEQLIQEWCLKNNVVCTILRLPLVAGPNPPGNLHAMISGLKKGYYVNINSGKARKSIVLAEDVARIIPKAAPIGGIYNLTDGYHPSFYEISLLIAKQLGENKPGNIPDWMAILFARIGDIIGPKAPINSSKLQKITSELTFDDSSARKELGWKPRPVLKEFHIYEP